MIISIATGPWLPVPALQGGAISRLWQGLAEEFAAQGHEVQILCRSYPGQPPTEMLRGVQYVRYGGFPQSPNITLDLLKDLIYAALVFPTLPPADILVINDFWLPVFAALRPIAGKIVINAARFPKGQYWLYQKTAFFAAASQAIQEAIVHQYPAAIPKIQVVPNPLNTRVFFPAPPRCEEEKVILYVGRIHAEKGIHLLIDAFSILSKQMPSARLNIVGPYRENQGGSGEKYLHLLKTKAMGLKIAFLEPIFDVQRLAQTYRDADLFCYPSLAEKGESFGLAPLEAMASGLVPVVSSLDCFRDFIAEKQTGYFFEHQGSEAAIHLASVLSIALLDWETTLQMREAAIIKALDFGYERVAAMYLTRFEKLIEQHN